MLSTMMQYPLTLTPILERAGKLFGRVEVCSRRPDRTLYRSTYAEVCRRSRALASALTSAGVARGDRVASLMWNHVWHLESYFGVPASGAVLHTLNLRLHPDELTHIVRDAGDRILIVDDVLLPTCEKFRDKVSLERVIVVPTSGAPVPPGYESYEDFLAHAGEAYNFPSLQEDEAAVMCYTSGTTGLPKGVVYSHRALNLHSLAIALPDGMCLSQADSVLPVVPMFHANAWGCPFAATMVGARQVLPGPHLDAASILELLENEHVTRTAGVPTVWFGLLEMLDQHPGRYKLDPRLLVFVGGAAMPESMVRGFDRHGIDARQGWGMTEITPVGTVSNLKSCLASVSADERIAIRARQGTPLPFIEVRGISGDREIPWDGKTIGELQVRGPWVAASYHNLAHRESWTPDGWFRTGDVVTIDAEGYIKIADRTKDMIKSGGEWISSVDLENMLMGHEAVREAAVIAIPHPKWQERPLAAVVLKPGCHVTPEELHRHLSARFSNWQLPDAFVFVPELPRTSVGKIQKSSLRETFAGWQWQKTSGNMI